MRSRGWASTLGAWLLVLAAGIGLSSLIPPIQSPDEHSHLLRAYLISKGELGLSTPGGMSSGGAVDPNLLVFVDVYLSTIVRSAQTPPSQEQLALAESLQWGQPERFFPLPGTGYYFPLIYAPHAAALWGGRTFGLTIADSYRFVRIASMLVCVGLLAAAWRVARPPPLAIALLLLPMTLFQLLSPTLDGTTTCLAVLTLSLFASAMTQERPWRSGSSWLLAGCVALLAMSRVQLLPLLALPLYVAWTRGSRRDAWLGTTAVVASLAWVTYALGTTVDLRVQREQATAQLLLQYAADPLAFLRIVGNSLADGDLGAFYAHSFIGVLGWLDTYLPLGSYPVLWAGLAACAIASATAGSLRQAWPARLLLIVAAFGSALLVFLALLVTWTPHPAATVEGVQGRYFVVPAMILAYAIGAASPGRPMRWPTLALLAGVATVSLYALVATLLARYH
jgi:uncharacterized membrane protein